MILASETLLYPIPPWWTDETHRLGKGTVRLHTETQWQFSGWRGICHSQHLPVRRLPIQYSGVVVYALIITEDDIPKWVFSSYPQASLFCLPHAFYRTLSGSVGPYLCVLLQGKVSGAKAVPYSQSWTISTEFLSCLHVGQNSCGFLNDAQTQRSAGAPYLLSYQNTACVCPSVLSLGFYCGWCLEKINIWKDILSLIAFEIFTSVDCGFIPCLFVVSIHCFYADASL